MSNNSFKVKNSLTLTPQDLSLLVNPEAGDIACDINDSNKIKRYDSVLTAWVEVGSLAAAGDLDSLLTQDFEQSSLSNFTQTGLILDSVSPLNDTKSAKLIHQPAINQSFKQTIPVDEKFRGRAMTVSLSAKSTASSGNVTILFRDETNAVDLQSSQQISADSTIKTFQFGVTIPSNCLSFSYTITALPEAGSPTTSIDDIVIRDYWMGTSVQGQTQYTYNSVETQSTEIAQTATFGFGNITGAPTDTSGSGIYSYNSSTGVYTVLKPATISASISLSAAGAAGPNAAIYKNSILVSIDTVNHATQNWGSASAEFTVITGDTFRFTNETTSSSDRQRIFVSATAAVEKTITSTDLVPAKAMAGNASISVPKITEWQSYTPTFQGFGTPTNVEAQFRQNGGNHEYRVKFVSGTPTAVEARVGLAPGKTSAGTDIIPSIQFLANSTRGTSASPAAKELTVLVEPNVTYLTFGYNRDDLSNNPLTKTNGSNLVVSGDVVSFFASVPIAGLSANETKTWSATQSVVTTEQDSSIQRSGTAGYGTTTFNGIYIKRFASDFVSPVGSNIVFSTSTTTGDLFTVQKDGIYHISYTDVDVINGDAYLYLYADSQLLGIASLANENGEYYGVVSASPYLKAGTVVRVGSNLNNNTSNNSRFIISHQGSVKQVQTNSDQKIKIPTSELRFEGASSRGSVATTIVKFDNIAKIRGDAFEVVSTAADGTYVRMKKAGRLSVSARLYNSTASAFRLTKNQVNLTTTPSQSEVIGSFGNSSSATGSTAAWIGDVIEGDTIRVEGSVSPTSNFTNGMDLSFQEQDISVSVTNVLPQFSESDSSVRVDVANGFGSTATRIRRFSNIRDNIGTDVEYTDSSVNGASFTIKSSGTYSISFSSTSDSGGVVSAISRNAIGSELSTDATTLVANSPEKILANGANAVSEDSVASWTGYLSAGDIIRPHTNGSPNSTRATRERFTISKIGKPNVTGVNVTPFVNVPQPERQYVSYSQPAGYGSVNNKIPYWTTENINTNNGIIKVVNSSSLGFSVTALKKCTVNMNAAYRATTAVEGGITLNSSQLTTSVTSVTDSKIYGYDLNTTTFQLNSTIDIELNVGDTLRIHTNGATINSVAYNSMTILAEALSDQILTAPESFSTDTASLRYAPSSEYTLSTLANAPVGTYITHTYAASSNTRTQTTTRPTQTDADMNVNGIQVFTRAYNAASTAGSPASVAIQIGKGLKGTQISAYVDTAKTKTVALDAIIEGSNVNGMRIREYNANTGVLILDAGINTGSSTAASFLGSDGITVTNAYFVINASKSPALTGVPALLPRIATIKDVKPSGTHGGSATGGVYQTRTLNTLTDPSGIVTSLSSNQFTLPAGEYYIEANVSAYCDSGTPISMHKGKVRNITDSTDSIIGSSERIITSTSGTGTTNASFIRGVITISSPKTFEIQHRTTSSGPSFGLGIANSFGEDEVYTQVKITKVK
jgi:hypothetical protein